MSTRWIAIVNPAAGGGRCGDRALDAIAELRRAGLELEVFRTTKPGDASAIAREHRARGADRFLAIGGDGTSFEIVNGLLGAHGDPSAAPTQAEAEARIDAPRRASATRPGDAASRPLGERGPTGPPCLAQLPLGTGNSFLRDFGIRDACAAMRAIIAGADRPCDVMRVIHARGTLYAINIVGIGFTAEAGALANRRYKAFGAAGYVIGVLRAAVELKCPAYPLRLDGGRIDARPAVLLSFCNSRCTAGTMQMAPHAVTDDGELDVIRVGPRGRLSFVSAFPSIFRGTHVQRAGVEETRARRVDLELDGREIDAMIDGEVSSLALRSIEIVPGALRIVV